MKILLFFSLLLLSVVSPAHSTTLLRFNLETLTSNSAQIFVGTCVASNTEIIDGQIFTHTRFAVAQTIKGNLPDQISVYLPGGTHRNARTQIAGMPSFAGDEEVVLFLTPQNQRGHAWPVGLAQGKFLIERSGPTGQARVSQNLDDLSFYSPPGTAKQLPTQTNLQDMPLEDFLARVRALANTDNGGEDAQ